MDPHTTVGRSLNTTAAPLRWSGAALAVTMAGLLLIGGVAEAAPSPLRFGDPATPFGVVPTLMGRFTTVPIDLDGDGTIESIVLSTDGVMHRYDANGRFAWGIDTQDVLGAVGLFGENAGHFLAPMQGAMAPAPAGPVFVDLNGDGILDIIAVMLVAEDAPANRYHSAIVRIDGANGQIIDVDLHDGVIRTLLLDDLNGNGQDDLFLAEENGPETLIGAHTIGTGGDFRAWLEHPITKQVYWQHTDDLPWATVTAAVVAQLTGLYPDIVLALTEPQAAFQPDLDLDPSPHGQRLVAIGGTFGGIIWDVPLGSSLVRDILTEDLDGDGIDDLVLRIQEQEQRVPSLGDERARIEARSGADGAMMWGTAQFGNRPIVHDIAYLPGGTDRIAVAYTERSTATYPAEDLERLRLLSRTGTSVADETLQSSNGISLDLIESTLGRLRVERPSALSETPDVHHMSLAVADIDGDGTLDLITGSARGMNGLRVQSSGVAPVWSHSQPADRDFFQTVVRPAGTELWTQDVDGARTLMYRVTDGGLIRQAPLIGLMSALERADLTANGQPDRIVGGASNTVFAFQGETQQVLWQRGVGAPVIDLKATDANKDGTPDLLAVTTKGAVLLDGRDGKVMWSHTHALDAKTGAWRFAHFNNDNVLDVVIGTQTKLGPAHVIALSGASGAPFWTHHLPPHLVRVTGLATGDIDRDGVPDVAVTAQSLVRGLTYSVGAIDGKNGFHLWRVESVGHGGRTTLERHPIEMVDATGDTQLDVVVAIPGGAFGEASLRAHGGRTGIPLWEEVTATDTPLTHIGLWKGFVGPSGAESLIVASETTDGSRITLLTPKGGQIVHVDYPGLTHLTDVQTGDVNGNGIHDILLASPQGLAVLNSGPTVAGSTSHIGHLTTWSATKARLIDLDGDGRAAVQFFAHERNHPIAHGNEPFMDAGRGKSFGGAAMPGSTAPPPQNLPPVANIVVQNTPVQGQPVYFQSTSFDPDGTITNQTWRFPDGSEQYGANAEYTWNTPGIKKVSLTVMDNEGATGSAHVDVDVQAIYAHAAVGESIGGYAVPGQTYVFNLTITNTGVENDTYEPQLIRSPDGWNTALATGSVQLSPGATATISVEVEIEVPRPSEVVRIGIRSLATGVIEDVGHRILVPLTLEASLFQGQGPYGPLDDIGGIVTARWHDGSPVSGLELRVVKGNGQEGSATIGANGQTEFLVQKDLLIANLPGDETVTLYPVLEHYTHGRTLAYTVEATA